MSLINDHLDEIEENEMFEVLKDFVQDDDFVFDNWRNRKIFDYMKCIKRVVEIANGK